MNRTIFESYSCSEESVYSTIAENFSSALRLTTPCLPSSEAMDSTQVKWNEQGQDNSGKEIELESSALDNMDDSEQNEIMESSLSQNTYVMIWVIASLASLAIYVKYF